MRGTASHIWGTSLVLLLSASYTYSSFEGLPETRAPEVCLPENCPEPFSNSFMTLDQISWYLNALSENNIRTDLITKFRSELNRIIYVVRIRPYMTAKPVNPRSRPDRPTYFMEAGFASRSGLPTSTALHLIHKLSQHSCSTGCDHIYYIVPLANPDGYEHARALDETWSKTRSIEGRGCFGIDMNRNYPSAANTSECGSADPCSESFRGRTATSSTEVRELVSLKYSISNMKLSLTMEGAGEPLLMYPKQLSESHVPIAQAYVGAAKNATNPTQLKAYEDVHGCEGGSSMHFTHSANISPLAFSLMVQNGTSDDIMAEASRAYDGISAMISDIEEKAQTGDTKSLVGGNGW